MGKQMHELDSNDLRAVSGGLVLPWPGTPPLQPLLPMGNPYPNWSTPDRMDL